MKILMVISMGYIAGGAEKSVAMMKHELAARGHDVRVLCTDTPGVNFFGDYTFKPISKQSVLKSIHHLFYFRSYVAMRRAVRDFKPDIIHFHTLTAFTPSVLYATGRVPAVMTIHGPEEFTLELLPWFMDDQDFRQNTFDLAHLTLRGRLKYLYYLALQRPIYRLGLRRLRLVIAPSKYMLKATAPDFGRVPMKLIYNGIDLPNPQPLPKSQAILFVGRLERLKGVEYLLRAFARTSGNATLRIVGDGPQRDYLERLAAELSITERTQFAGWVPQERLSAEYANATVLVVPSVCPEAMGLVAIEAMASGRPVIGSAMGGIPELIHEGRTGYIVPPANPGELAAAIDQLLQTHNLPAISQAAAQSAQAFGAQIFLDQIESTYREITQPA
jgi:glycosyltransferase involved in cell wall biosynthesis